MVDRLQMATAIYAEMSEQLKHAMGSNPESQSYICRPSLCALILSASNKERIKSHNMEFIIKFHTKCATYVLEIFHRLVLIKETHRFGR
jgi:hypothetical protein